MPCFGESAEVLKMGRFYRFDWPRITLAVSRLEMPNQNASSYTTLQHNRFKIVFVVDCASGGDRCQMERSVAESREALSL